MAKATPGPEPRSPEDTVPPALPQGSTDMDTDDASPAAANLSSGEISQGVLLPRRRRRGDEDAGDPSSSAGRSPSSAAECGSASPAGAAPASPGGASTAAAAGSKPPLSYVQLISMAIRSSPEQRLVLSEIYAWISAHYPYFRPEEKAWK
ncbi:Foxq2 protein, partial [Cladochytrium tenue]